MDEDPIRPQGDRRPELLPGDQPVRLPPVRDAALARQETRHDHGAVGHELRAHEHLVGAGEAVDAVHYAVPGPPAGRAVRGGRLLLLWRRRAEHDLPWEIRPDTAASGRLRFRRLRYHGTVDPNESRR